MVDGECGDEVFEEAGLEPEMADVDVGAHGFPHAVSDVGNIVGGNGGAGDVPARDLGVDVVEGVFDTLKTGL